MTALSLFARDPRTRQALTDAAARVDLEVRELAADPARFGDGWQLGAIVRAPGGLVAAAQRLGSPVCLTGPAPEWFAGLGAEITGRPWRLLNPAAAGALLADGPAFVKLADAKRREFPARRFGSAAELRARVDALGATADLQLLVTTGWLDLHSEYRVFTVGRAVVTVSPYLVFDEPWSPLLHTHRASLHDDAAVFASDLLQALPDVPPAAALDVARLADGRFVLLEANQAWSAGLYGCDPDAVLRSVTAANTADDSAWTWRADPSLP